MYFYKYGYSFAKCQKEGFLRKKTGGAGLTKQEPINSFRRQAASYANNNNNNVAVQFVASHYAASFGTQLFVKHAML